MISTFLGWIWKPNRNPAPRRPNDMGGGPRVTRCGFVVFFRSPGGLEATKGPHSAARAYPTQRRHARLTRHDKTDAAPTGNASNGRRWVWACAHNIITDPRPTTPRSTPQRAKRAHERERRRPRQPQVPRRNSETRPRRDPDANPTTRARASDNRLHA